MMKKGPDAKDGEVCIEDRISGLSDEILGHILSYVSTRDVDPRTLKEYDLPRSYNLKHLDLLLEACCSWEFLTKLLSLSPNLECLVLECNIKCSLEHSEDHLVHQWCLPDCVPICLLCLKTICIRGFQGRPDEIEMVEYFLKHGEVLSNVTIHDSTICAGSSMRVLSMLPRASKSCQLKFQK
ncbi:hypothetical protein ACLB2K_024306 [Fragaria x ananassa]